jgi:hypothetical protein
VYVVSLITLRPTLHDDSQVQKFVRAKDKFMEKEHEIIGKVKSKFNHIRGDRKGSKAKESVDAEPWKAFHQNVKERFEKIVVNDKKENTKIIATTGKHELDVGDVSKLNLPFMDATKNKPTNGFVVLGMHRSGTSMLSGLLVEGFGYEPGEPLIGASFDNEKGFFELVPAVLQNDEFFMEQGMYWASFDLQHYDAERALQAKEDGKIPFIRGERALNVLNNDPSVVPWLQKDPRMCIAFRTWLPLLNSKPAVLFTYRNPLEVAMSLKQREGGFTIRRGLKLWIIYNKAAIINSADMCRVYSSNDAVFSNPMTETERIVQELTECGVPKPPSEITQSIVDSFIDPSLLHNKNNKAGDVTILERYGECDIPSFSGSPSDEDMYLHAMRIYCDLQSGVAYHVEYKWPDI